MVESGTMKVIMGAPHSTARLPSAALLSWASLSGSKLSELLLNFAQTQQNVWGALRCFGTPTQHVRGLSTTALPCPAGLYRADKALFLMLVAVIWPGFS